MPLAIRHSRISIAATAQWLSAVEIGELYNLEEDNGFWLNAWD